jgi:hypothetical protein
MLICLWKGCEHKFEETAAFQKHIIQHGQEQVQLKVVNKTKDGIEEEAEPLAKRAKLNEGEIAKGVEIGRR